MRSPLLHLGVLLAAGCALPQIPDPDGLVSTYDADTGDLEPASICPGDLEPVIESGSGCIWGSSDGVVESFVGVPYAEPPVDALRFAAPFPVTPWTEPLAAGAAGSPCLQTGDTKDGALQDGEGDEDCLTLNIWRPVGAEKLPILFYIHGGGFLNGAGSVSDLAGSATLPESAVVVTHNYRLGPFGYLAHPALTAESPFGTSGDQGALDSLLALQWIRDNAEAIGGDASQIVLVGQEAGGLQACALLMSPLTDGMFSAAVLQSAPCGWLDRPRADEDSADEGTSTDVLAGEEVGEQLAAALGCTGTDAQVLSCLRVAPAESVRNALIARPARLMDGDNAPWEPVVDGYVLEDDVATLVQAGLVPELPVFVGANPDEGTIYSEDIGADTISGFALDVTLGAILTEHGATDVSAIPEGMFSATTWGDAATAYEAFYGYATVICPTRTFLAALREARPRVYAYTFTHPPSFADPTLGAYTGAEVPFLFGTHSDQYTGLEAQLSAQLQATWIWTLSNEPWVLDLGAWPDGADRSWVNIGDSDLPEVVADPYAEICDAFDAAGWRPM